jgi:hypothetical protein
MELHVRLALFFETIERALEQAKRLTGDANQTLYEAAIQNIAATLKEVDMRGNWTQYGSVFDARALAILEGCENVIDQRLAATQPQRSDLDSVLQDVRAARAQVAGADIDPEAKRILLDMLRDVERALLAFEISGVDGLRRAVAHTMGMMALNHATLSKSGVGEAAAATFRAIGRLLALLKMADFATQLPEKAATVYRLLGP